jgi:hypothetical protein
MKALIISLSGTWFGVRFIFGMVLSTILSKCTTHSWIGYQEDALDSLSPHLISSMATTFLSLRSGLETISLSAWT